MNLQLECILGFENNRWVLRCDDFEITAAEWEDLKASLRQIVEKRYPGRQVEVAYYFDMQHIPRWFHQYQTHYFNGKFIINT